MNTYKLPALQRFAPPALLLAALPVIAASFAGGLITQPAIGGWYAGLAKPWFNPPNWVFGPVWTVLFAMIGYAAWRILRLPAATPGRAAALRVHFVQLLVNVGWSAAFFGLNSPVAGLAVIVPFLGLIGLTIRRFSSIDRLAGRLLWPYFAWVSYATLLNIALWWLNR